MAKYKIRNSDTWWNDMLSDFSSS